MKNFFNIIMGLGLLLFSTLNLNAQTEPQVAIGETIIFPHQDSLKATLERFGIRLIDFPEWATQCPKFKAELPDGGKKSPWEPYIDTTKVVHRPGTDTSTIDKEINIVWVHGLNGSKNSLYPPAYATQVGIPGIFPARRAKSHGTQGDAKEQLYSENYGITPASFDVSYFANLSIPPSARTNKDFVIGHSQGGIVAREWLRNIKKQPANYPNLVHGLVTFGTPHGGAQILNNCRPNLGNKVPAFMNHACHSLSGALVTPKINSNFWTSLLISKSLENEIKGFMCNALVNTVIPLSLSSYYKETTKDYYVNSPFLIGRQGTSGHIEGLSEYAMDVPVVQFYGVEEQPILWRFLGSTLGIGNDEGQLSQDKFFAYGNDDKFVADINAMINEFQWREESERNRAEFHRKRMHKTLFLGSKMKYKEAKENADAYYLAWAWLSQANEFYLTDLVGGKVVSSTLECRIIDNIDCSRTASNPRMDPLAKNLKVSYNFVSTGTTCTLAPINTLYKNYTHQTPTGPEFMGNCEGTRITFPTWKNTYYYKDNDGVVLAESAKQKIKMSDNPLISHVVVPMPKTNHEQMKNSEATKRALYSLYNGENGLFFKVEPR
jgi:hypothetical protein